jgi:hypothetical protein
MRVGIRSVCAALVAAVLATFTVGTASAQGVAQSSIVSAVPGDRTPQILDTSATVTEKVLAMAQVGNRIVVAGVFSQVRDVKANGGATYSRTNVFAFDPVTGAVDTGFAPVLNGVVTTVLAGADGTTVYLGGSFTHLNGACWRNVVQLSLATGVRTAFRAPLLNGATNDLALVGGRLIVGGQFTAVGGIAHGGLATLNATTGALDAYMGIDVALHHNYPDRGTANAAVGVENVDVTPDGTRMIVIGNFRQADGLVRDQAFMVLLQPTGAVVDPNWKTTGFESVCNSKAFDSWVRDVQFSPDGSYFVVVTTGGPYTGTLCDAASRWETAATGQAVTPRWVANTGGDTLFSVAVSGSAVYLGGHERWLNNPNGRDSAGAGAVPRPGVAALDPRTGIPLSWNPGRNPRGDGAEALLLTDTGLYVGSDTDHIGNRQYLRPRLAWFPLPGGSALPNEDTGSLPTNVYAAGRATATASAAIGDVRARFYTGTSVGTDVVVGAGGTDWSRARGAFMAGDTLVYGYPNAAGSYYLYRRTFDGGTFGPATAIDPYNDPYWSTISTGSKRNDVPILYRGVLPAFYGQLATVTGMVFENGRLYYTRSGSSQLFYRYFSVDSGIVGGTEFTAASTGFNDVAGMFVAGGNLYWASNATADLRRIAFSGGVVSGTVTTASPGPAAGGRDWRSRTLFLGPGPNQVPTATFTSSCAGRACSFDAAGSVDPDGTIATYSWDFGDGTSATGITATHTYGTDGDRPVTLTVTDTQGGAGQSVQTVSASEPVAGTGIDLRASAGRSARGVTTVSLPVPAEVAPGDGLVLVLSTNSDATGTAPAGFVLEGSQTSGGNITTQVWSRAAVAGDAGSTLTVPLNKSAKVTLQLLAYSGTSTADPVASVTGAVDIGGTAHTAPTAPAAQGSWVLSIWSDKQSVARTWAPPSSGVQVRSNLDGVGTGDMATLVVDGGAPVPAGTVGGLVATVPTTSNRATAFTVVLAPQP